MKKIIASLIMVSVISVMGNVCSAFAEQTATVKVYNNRYECVIINDRTYIPMRNVFEALGYKVDWLADEKAVTLGKDNTELTLYTKTSSVTGYGTLNNEVKIVNERTYLPFRELLNILGYEVDWDADTKTAIVVIPDAETTTEETTTTITTTTTTTTTITTEATTETTTDIIYDNDLYIGDTPVGSKQELIDAIINNAKQNTVNRPNVDELIAMVSVDDFAEEQTED
jgi:hypothetical protein